jgi:hypothetical protein
VSSSWLTAPSQAIAPSAKLVASTIVLWFMAAAPFYPLMQEERGSCRKTMGAR